MSKTKGFTLAKCSFAALLLSQGYLLGGCDQPSETEKVGSVPESVVDDDDLRAWTGSTSEELPPLTCRHGQAIRGINCTGSYCDNLALDCRGTGLAAGEHTWLPYFSEEGTGTSNQGRCVGNSMWMTGVVCQGSYCDNLSVQCSHLLGSSTGTCQWSDWYSEEDGPFTTPDGRYIKAIECDGDYCDNKRYRFCRMK